jgi:hypothetical protein
VYKDDGGDDNFGVMLPDGSGALRLKQGGMDVTDMAQGFAYVPHWIEAP